MTGIASHPSYFLADATKTGVRADIAPSDAHTHALDLTVWHAQMRRGDIMAWLTWLRRPNGYEPCIVLTPANIMVSHERCIPCIVPLSQIWKWDEAAGEADHAMAVSGLFCMNLNMNPHNRAHVFKIASIVRDLIGELIRTPPRPSDVPKEVVAEMNMITPDGKVVAQREVHDDA